MTRHTPSGNEKLKQARETRGLTQSELAVAVQLTRQSISAIESGRATPSVDVALRIAKALSRSVEELFGQDVGEPSVVAEMASSAASGRLLLAHLFGRWVAHGLRGQDVCTSADALGTIERRQRRARVDLVREPSEAHANVLFMGCAAGLGVLADRLNATREIGRFVWIPSSSTAALEALARNHTHLAGVHLVDTKTGDENVPDVRRVVPGARITLITLGRWEMGLVRTPARTSRVRSQEDLSRRGLRIAMREKGSGARRLLERELRGAGVPVAQALTHAVPARGHLEVSQLVALGVADTGITTRDAALAFDLDFVPLLEERYDLAFRSETESDARIQRMLNGMTSVGFRRELSCLGYDVRSCGDRAAEVSAA